MPSIGVKLKLVVDMVACTGAYSYAGIINILYVILFFNFVETRNLRLIGDRMVTNSTGIPDKLWQPKHAVLDTS